MSRSSWVKDNGEIDHDFLEWGAKQPRRISTELIKPPSITVPYIPWLADDDDVIAKMRKRGLLASHSESTPDNEGI